jgi:hypothetical protein
MGEVLLDFTSFNLDFDLIARIFLFGALLLYVIYTFLIYKQVNLLNRSIQTRGAPLLNLVALVQLLVTLTVFLGTVFLFFF